MTTVNYYVIYIFLNFNEWIDYAILIKNNDATASNDDVWTHVETECCTSVDQRFNVN